MNNISVIQGDITAAEVDAIVNAANPLMLGGGGVDGAIHRAAGPNLLEACKKVPVVDGIRCPIGQARITTAADLPSRYVIHTVGPRYFEDPEPSKLLASAYRNSLLLVAEHKCQSIAFPAISCGVYAYPPEEAVKIAVTECAAAEFRAMDIRFYLFSQDMTEIWKKHLASHCDDLST